MLNFVIDARRKSFSMLYVGMREEHHEQVAIIYNDVKKENKGLRVKISLSLARMHACV
jgi:hypothetical protein